MARTPRDAPIRYEGLDELRRAMRRFERDAPAFLTVAQKGVSAFVRDMAIWEAHTQFEQHSGDLIAQLQPGVTGTTGWVRDFARHGGYNYPGRLEYENNGERSFIRSAIRKGEPEIVARMDAAIVAAVAEFNRGGI